MVPLLVLTVGALLVTSTLRATTAEAIELRDECARLDELRTELAALRGDGNDALAALDGLRARTRRPPPDR